MGKLIIVLVALTTVFITVVDGRNRSRKGSSAAAPSSSRPSLQSMLYERQPLPNPPPAIPSTTVSTDEPESKVRKYGNLPRWSKPPLVINMNGGQPELASANYTGRRLAPRIRPRGSQSKKNKVGPPGPPSQADIGNSSSSGQSAGTKRLSSRANQYCKSGTEQISIYDYNFDSHNPNQHPDQYTSRHQNPHPEYSFTNTNPGQYPFGYPSTYAFSTNQPFPPTFSSNTNLERYSQPGQYTSGYPQPNPGYPSTNAFTIPPTLPPSSVPDCTLDQYIGMGLRYNQIRTKWLTPAERQRLEELKPQLSTPPTSPL